MIRPVLLALALAITGCAEPAPGPEPIEAEPAPAPEPSAAPAAKPVPAPSGPATPEGAEACLLDDACPMTEFVARSVGAVDAGRGGMCGRFVSGAGVPRDPGRARACLETELAKQGACGGSSPSSYRVQLFLLLVQGEGGPIDLLRAAALIDGCFEDATMSSLRPMLTSEPGAAPKSSCDVAMTTVAMIECALQQTDEAGVAMMAAEKDLARRAPGAGPALKRARDAFELYQRAQAEWVSDEYRGGTLSSIMYASTMGALVTARAELLRSTAPSAPTDPHVAARVAKLGSHVDAEARRLLDTAGARYRAYRRLELEALAIALGPSADRKALGTAMDARWLTELERRRSE